jgi:hypothetical protein
MKHKDRVSMAMGFVPALNLRWVDCHERYAGKFDPDCWGWRERARPHEIMGRPFLGVVPVSFGTLFGPMFGRGPEMIPGLSAINPIEIMERTHLQDGELNLYIAYTGRDEFNIDTEVESFLFAARQRGITVASDFDPRGRHNIRSGAKLFPAAVRWAAPLVPSALPETK